MTLQKLFLCSELLPLHSRSFCPYSVGISANRATLCTGAQGLHPGIANIISNVIFSVLCVTGHHDLGNIGIALFCSKQPIDRKRALDGTSRSIMARQPVKYQPLFGCDNCSGFWDGISTNTRVSVVRQRPQKPKCSHSTSGPSWNRAVLVAVDEFG